MPCPFLGGVRSISSRLRFGLLADVGAQPMGHQRWHAGTLFHVGDGARRLDGLCTDHLLHYGLWLFRRGDISWPSASRQSLGMDCLLDGDRWRRDGADPDHHGSGFGALHILSAAHGEPLVLYRTGSCRCRLVGLVHSHVRRDARVEARKSGAARAVGDVRNGRKRGDVALDHRRRSSRTAFPGHSGIAGHRANHRCWSGTHVVLVDAARHRLFLAHSGIHRALHDDPARGRRTPLQRYDGPPHLHSVSGL